jgi:hypothetical protein
MSEERLINGLDHKTFLQPELMAAMLNLDVAWVC